MYIVCKVFTGPGSPIPTPGKRLTHFRIWPKKWLLRFVAIETFDKSDPEVTGTMQKSKLVPLVWFSIVCNVFRLSLSGCSRLWNFFIDFKKPNSWFCDLFPIKSCHLSFSRSLQLSQSKSQNNVYARQTV